MAILGWFDIAFFASGILGYSLVRELLSALGAESSGLIQHAFFEVIHVSLFLSMVYLPRPRFLSQGPGGFRANAAGWG